MAQELKKELKEVKELKEKLNELTKTHQKEMQRIINIANAYIKSYRDLMAQIKTTVDTHINLEALLNKQEKE